jgi:hypothetical protein
MRQQQRYKPIIDAAAARIDVLTFEKAVVAAQTLATEAQIAIISSRKNDLIEIMADYLNQRKTRIETVDRLKVLSATIS